MAFTSNRNFPAKFIKCVFITIKIAPDHESRRRNKKFMKRFVKRFSISRIGGSININKIAINSADPDQNAKKFAL